MNVLAIVSAILVALLLALFGASRIGTYLIERRHPPIGAFATVNGTRMHFVHVPASAGATLPPVVFIHGASGNLLDQTTPLLPLLDGKAELLFLDRPGHGWSERGAAENATPYGQAHTIAALMAHLGIDKAIIVGHSFGGAVAAAFALEHPGETKGLVFLAAATHPWPGAWTSWYYRLTGIPVIGRLFSETFIVPGGMLTMRAGTDCVFAPNAVPETYVDDAAVELVLRPESFRYNAEDVEGLYDHVVEASKRYGEIKVPTVIISGDRDTVVLEEIHSVSLARDIKGAELVWVHNLGHKPDHVVSELVVAAIETIAGQEAEAGRDLHALARAAEARIADDAFGPIERCTENKLIVDVAETRG